MYTDMVTEHEIWNFAIKIGSATLSGLLLGLEREYKGKSAGLKTNTLVAIGAAVFVIISQRYGNTVGVDVTRVLSHVVVGIGFLGAGVIIQKKDKITGLTTAATIWCSAAVGCLAATEMYIELIMITVLVILVNLIFGYLELRTGVGDKK